MCARRNYFGHNLKHFLFCHWRSEDFSTAWWKCVFRYPCCVSVEVIVVAGRYCLSCTTNFCFCSRVLYKMLSNYVIFNYVHFVQSVFVHCIVYLNVV